MAMDSFPPSSSTIQDSCDFPSSSSSRGTGKRRFEEVSHPHVGRRRLGTPAGMWCERNASCAACRGGIPCPHTLSGSENDLLDPREAVEAAVWSPINVVGRDGVLSSAPIPVTQSGTILFFEALPEFTPCIESSSNSDIAVTSSDSLDERRRADMVSPLIASINATSLPPAYTSNPIPVTSDGVAIVHVAIMEPGNVHEDEVPLDEDTCEECSEDELVAGEDHAADEGLEEEESENLDAESDAVDEEDDADSGLSVLFARLVGLRRRLTELGESDVAPNMIRLSSMLDRVRDFHEGLDTESIEANTATMTWRSNPGKNSSVGVDNTQCQCMICLEDFKISEKLRILPCFHRYHSSCIDTWLSRDARCPICKHNISFDAVSQVEPELQPGDHVVEL